MIYTGLNDVDDRKIYDGDTANLRFGIPPTSVKVEVSWDEGSLSWIVTGGGHSDLLINQHDTMAVIDK